MKTNHILAVVFILLSLSAITSCSGSGKEPAQALSPPTESQTETAQVRVIHASPDAPTVNVLADGEVLGFLVGVDYQQASENFTFQSGSAYEFALQAITTDGAVDAISTNLTTQANFSYDIVAVGSISSNTLEFLTLSNLDSELAQGYVRARMLHAAEDLGMVDIYITAVNEDIESAQTNATLSYKDSSGEIEVAGGEYQIRLTPAGSLEVLFDSGPIILPADSEFVVLVTQNVTTGDAPVSLVISDGNNSSVVLDKDTPASIRIVHGVSDAPAVDVIANNSVEIVGDVSFLSVTEYVEIAVANNQTEYLIVVASTANNATVVINDATINLEAGQHYTAIANNQLSNIDLDLAVDNVRRVATNAKIRLFHAASTTGDVDIYITPDGNIADVEPGITDIPYLTDELAQTGYILLEEGDYIISVTPANSKDILVESNLFSAQNNRIYTVFVVNGETVDSAINLILADDF